MAMNFSEEEKKKMLADDSEIYQKREDGLDANNGELKKLKGRKKGEYFRQYYMGSVAVLLVIAILAVLFFKNAFASSKLLPSIVPENTLPLTPLALYLKENKGSSLIVEDISFSSINLFTVSSISLLSSFVFLLKLINEKTKEKPLNE